MSFSLARLIMFFWTGLFAFNLVGYCQSAYGYNGYSSDGTMIYTWTVLSGDMTGASYFHRYYATNVIGSVGGTAQAGPTASAVTLRNDQSIIATPGTDYLWHTEASAYCDFVGPAPFYIFGDNKYVAIKITYGVNSLGHQDVPPNRYCGYTPACSNGVTPACGDPSWTVVGSTAFSCYYHNRMSFLAIRSSPSEEYSCFGIQFPAGGPGPCDP